MVWCGWFYLYVSSSIEAGHGKSQSKEVKSSYMENEEIKFHKQSQSEGCPSSLMCTYNMKKL